MPRPVNRRARLGVLITAVCLCAPSPAQDPVPRLPLARPDTGFYGAIGRPLRASAAADPVRITGARPTTYTVTLDGVLNPADVARPDLAGRPEFAAFEVQPHPEAELIDAGKMRRTLVYRLRPRDADAAEIPGWPFRYYNPLIPAEGRRWHLAYPTAQIEPVVLERVAEPPPPDAPRLEVPGGYRTIDQDDASPSWPRILLIAAFVLEPAVIIGAVLLWPYLFPSKKPGARRSPAAVKAVRDLRRLRAVPGQEPAQRLGKIVACYLQDRFRLPAWARTPRDVAAHLEQIHRKGGIDYHSGKRCVELLEGCDRWRFARKAGDPIDDEAYSRAEQLILDLERFPA